MREELVAVDREEIVGGRLRCDCLPTELGDHALGLAAHQSGANVAAAERALAATWLRARRSRP